MPASPRTQPFYLIPLLLQEWILSIDLSLSLSAPRHSCSLHSSLKYLSLTTSLPLVSLRLLVRPRDGDRAFFPVRILPNSPVARRVVSIYLSFDPRALLLVLYTRAFYFCRTPFLCVRYFFRALFRRLAPKPL